MKGVLISIRKPHTDNIKALIKTIDVRKTKPRIERPFPAFIYEAKANGGCGKVIGEFVCDRINRIGKRGINNNFDYCYLSLNEWGNDDVEIEITDIQKSCISKSKLNAYGANSSCLYAWHISNLKIYEKPKELSEFFYACKQPKGTDCSQCIDRREKTCYSITRPPQSWCYVEVE